MHVRCRARYKTVHRSGTIRHPYHSPIYGIGWAVGFPLRGSMASITSILTDRFRDAIESAFAVEADPLVAPAQNEKFGDYQANAAMSLAKQVSLNPRQVAERIKGALKVEDLASEVSIAGPGF